MKTDKTLIRIFHRMPSEMTGTSRILSLLDSTGANLLRPMSIEELRAADFVGIINEAVRNQTSTSRYSNLVNRVHALPPALIPTDDFV